MIDCDFCGQPFEPTGTRWLCPHCKAKASCCEGAPLAEEPVDPVAWALKGAEMMPELRPTGRTPHQVAEVRPAKCPGCGHPWPRGVAGRVLVGTHKCKDHQHRTYFCQSCQQTAFDPAVEEGCREALRMGTPDGGLTE